MKSVLCILTFCILTTASSAQEHPAVAALPNSVYVGADGKFESAPDTAVLQFNISVQDDSAQSAYQHASKDVEQVRKVLRANNIEPKAATIGFFSVQPAYEYRNGKQKPIGYRVTTNVSLKLKDFSKIGPITEQLADANVSESQTLSYALENIDEAKNKAVEDAYRRARNSARYFREPTHSGSPHGARHVSDGERRSRPHGRIHASKRDGDGARERSVQSEMRMKWKNEIKDWKKQKRVQKRLHSMR